MKRWILKSGGYDLDALTIQDAPMPEPAPGEVRVRVEAASLNYRDHLVLSNPLWRRDIDLIPVADAAGIIDAVGEGVTGWKKGDAVMTVYMRDFPAWPPHPGIGMGLGSADEQGVLAEYVVLSEARIVRRPASLTAVEAATLPCAAHTAWTALQKLSPARPGTKVLILGTGGVSLFALALCRHLGIEAIITTSSEQKRQRLLELGASAVVNYRDDAEWGHTVQRLAGGVDKVINSAGVGALNQSMTALRPGGNVVTIGMITQGEGVPLDEYALMGKGLTIHGMPVGGKDGLVELAAFVDAAGLKPIIHQTFGFADAKLAYEEQRCPDLFGKVVITID
jgi:NADPH:quinone reductase-like Zn-dependent oxidoreductase